MKYKTEVALYEMDVNGNFVETPYEYSKEYKTLDDAIDGIRDLVWQAIEIERIPSGRLYICSTISEDGEWRATDECTIDAEIVRTNTPSKYIKWKKGCEPDIFTVDRTMSDIEYVGLFDE